jgi:hypothetical protein
LESSEPKPDPDPIDAVLARLVSKAESTPATPPTVAARRPRRLVLSDQPRALILPHKVRDLGQVHATVRTRIRKFLASSEPRWPLVIWGAVGCGKSCAALCLADRVPGAYCLTLRELVDLIMESRAGKLWRDAGPGEGMIRVSEWAIWRQLDRAPLVILDELGTRKAGDLEYEALKRTLDKREGRPMVCVSNHAPADLARLFDARISDRLEGGTVIEYPGGSRRR